MDNTFFVSLTPAQAAQVIDDAVLNGSITGEKIDDYTQYTPDGRFFHVAVYEKHYWRASNRLTLTVILDNFMGSTRVHCIGGGGGEGLFRFDWGASDSFQDTVVKALAAYRI